MGFIEEPYMGREEDGFVEVVVAIMGSLGTEISVRLTTENLSPDAQAISKSRCMCVYSESYIVLFKHNVYLVSVTSSVVAWQ